MHNPRYTKPTRLLTGLGLLVCLLLSLGSGRVLALDRNITCTGPGTGTGIPQVIELGEVQPNLSSTFTLTANCQTHRIFANGASLGYFQNNFGGSTAKIIASLKANGQSLPLIPPGTVGSVCVPNECIRLAAYFKFEYDVEFNLNHGSIYGSHSTIVGLHAAMIGTPENYDTIQTAFVTYTVVQPPCFMGTSNTLNLPFGTLNSSDFATSQQIADISINCYGSAQVTASLSPEQSATGAAGTSATSLPQLLMVATWADTNTPVTFNTPRTLALKLGRNSVRLGFRPKLASPDATPTGNFSSQYTLNITYL